MSLNLIYHAALGDFERAFKAIETPIAKAATATMSEAQKALVTGGRANIAAGGFGTRWQNALRADLYPRSGTALDPAVWVHHRIPYASIFQKGGTISGQPLLWLPLPTVPQRIGGRRMTPQLYVSTIGPLHTIKVPGKNPLLGAYMKGRARSRPTLPKLRAGSALLRLGVRRSRSDLGGVGLVSVPLFVGIPTVRLKKHFDLSIVFRKVQGDLAANYLKHIQEFTH